MKEPISNKKYQMLYNETARLRVISVLFRYPEKEFSLSDLAKEAGVAKANIGETLNNLSSAGFIEIIKLARIWRIKANQKNFEFIKHKISFNLGMIYNTSLIEFLTNYFENPRAISLFGSFRKGDDISTSDIDIAIETARLDEDKAKLKSLENRELKEFESLLGRKIQIHLFDRKNIDINLFNNIANGILLWGFLEVKI
jgi:predicted nucleotidyltransferase